VTTSFSSLSICQPQSVLQYLNSFRCSESDIQTSIFSAAFTLRTILFCILFSSYFCYMYIQLKHPWVWKTKLHTVWIHDVHANEVSLYMTDNGYSHSVSNMKIPITVHNVMYSKFKESVVKKFKSQTAKTFSSTFLSSSSQTTVHACACVCRPRDVSS
jgi:hypothetical protein